MQKSSKVYEIQTAFLDKESEMSNFSSYTIVAVDVQHALEKVAPMLGTKEYAEQVKLLAILDE